MNLDALSIALAQISFTIKNLTKKNFKTSSIEIANVCLIEKSFLILILLHLSSLFLNMDLKLNDIFIVF
jgi:hypothetical protein